MGLFDLFTSKRDRTTEKDYWESNWSPSYKALELVNKYEGKPLTFKTDEQQVLGDDGVVRRTEVVVIEKKFGDIVVDTDEVIIERVYVNYPNDGRIIFRANNGLKLAFNLKQILDGKHIEMLGDVD